MISDEELEREARAVREEQRRARWSTVLNTAIGIAILLAFVAFLFARYEVQKAWIRSVVEEGK